ncbi:MAG: sodium:proton antiporter [Bacteroidetes bacterium]|nr:sodium:proton antiporter [Bacteroidota bacterium]
MLILVFVLGYLAIAFEHQIRLNKASSALLTGVMCWVLYAWGNHDPEQVQHELLEHVGELSGIIFFLMGAMTIVELIDAHDGFDVISSQITSRSTTRMLLIITLLSFILSAVLDNLTTTIVMVSLASKLMKDEKERLAVAALIVISANAGGVWSPIGDVTTTMLWMGGQLTTPVMITHLLIPSIVAVLIPFLAIRTMIRQSPAPTFSSAPESGNSHPTERNLVFFSGLLALLFVPVFKTLTGLPPFMGMLFSLGAMWLVTEIIHSGKDLSDKHKLSVNYVIRKIDTPSILFFLGILLSVAALQSAGTLTELANGLSDQIGDNRMVVAVLGVLSSIVDNVPLVAAAQGMYSLTDFPQDHPFWQFMAYCTGTGGSILIIGSAAGVAAMGLTKIEFFWYVKKISGWALLGYLAGAITYLLLYWNQ